MTGRPLCRVRRRTCSLGNGAVSLGLFPRKQLRCLVCARVSVPQEIGRRLEDGIVVVLPIGIDDLDKIRRIAADHAKSAAE